MFNCMCMYLYLCYLFSFSAMLTTSDVSYIGEGLRDWEVVDEIAKVLCLTGQS